MHVPSDPLSRNGRTDGITCGEGDVERSSYCVLLRLIVTRSVVTLHFVIVVAGSGIPRGVAAFVGVILAAVFRVISVIPGLAAIAAGETNS